MMDNLDSIDGNRWVKGEDERYLVYRKIIRKRPVYIWYYTVRKKGW